jgi:two-component system sensor histidine kinase KdpD
LDPAASLETADLSIAQWVFDHGRPAGLGTDTLPAAPAQYLPLAGTQRTLGVLAVQPAQRRRLLLPEQRHLLETFAGQIALAIERGRRAEEAESSRVAVETESLRNSLLASISYDLRTPLAAIMAASHALSDPRMQPDGETRARLARSIETTAQEISELISNVLDLMSFQFGEVHLQRGWQNVETLVESALARLEGRLAKHPVEVALPANLPQITVDSGLVTRVLVNLLDNAVKHTPPGTHITISAGIEDGAVRVVVDDNGPGLPPGPSERLFEKFQRGRGDVEAGAPGGAGLGLAICKAIIDAHGGYIAAMHRPGGGARFVFTVPTVEAAARPT